MVRKGTRNRKDHAYGAPAARKWFRKAPKFGQHTDEDPYVAKVVRSGAKRRPTWKGSSSWGASVRRWFRKALKLARHRADGSNGAKAGGMWCEIGAEVSR